MSQAREGRVRASGAACRRATGRREGDSFKGLEASQWGQSCNRECDVLGSARDEMRSVIGGRVTTTLICWDEELA